MPRSWRAPASRKVHHGVKRAQRTIPGAQPRGGFESAHGAAASKAAEAEERTKKAGAGQGDHDAVWRRPPVTIGYTSSYDEREGTSPGTIPVVHVQSERGPV